MTNISEILYLNVVGIGIGALILWLLVVWTFLEVAFFLYIWFRLHPRLAPIKPGQVSVFNRHPADMIRDIHDLCESLESYSLQKFCSGFCLMSPLEEIYTENLESLYAWAIYTNNLENLTPNQRKELKILREDANDRFGMNLVEGYNPKVRHAKFNLEPLRYMHRPLLLHWLIYGSELYYTTTFLQANGFCFYKNGNYQYWYNGETKSNVVDMDAPAIVIFHGICSGWNYYSKLIKALHRSRRVILFDYDCVKLGSMVFDVPGPESISNAISMISKKHFISMISIISHSWGTFLAGWIVRLNPNLVVSLTMIDPIALTVVLPETTYFILYKPVKTFQDALVSYFVRNDLNISNTLHRNFAWYNCSLRFEDIPSHIGVAIGVGGKDELIHIPVVSELIQRHSQQRLKCCAAPIVSMHWENFEHGTCVLDDKAVKEISKSVYHVEEMSLFNAQK